MTLKTASTVRPLFPYSVNKMTLRTRLAVGMSLLFIFQSIALMLFLNLLGVTSSDNEPLPISILGLGFAALIGGVGSWWLAGVLLRPLRKVSRTARQISANTLHTRLSLSRPPDEVKELADAFDAMLDRLEEAFEQQSRFVADAAHELRTPLAIIHSNLELVLSNPHATLPDYQNISRTLERSIIRLERLVADLLVLAQSGQAAVSQNEIELLSILEDVIVELDGTAKLHQVTVRLETETEVEINGEMAQIRRVLFNLVENAIRYNRAEGAGQVWVSLENSPNEAIIQIRDSGTGIPAEAQARLFERFFRVEQSRSRHKGGVGLGLAIAEQIVRQHNGTIRLVKTDEGGSLFEVRLPH